MTACAADCQAARDAYIAATPHSCCVLCPGVQRLPPGAVHPSGSPAGLAVGSSSSTVSSVSHTAVNKSLDQPGLYPPTHRLCGPHVALLPDCGITPPAAVIHSAAVITVGCIRGVFQPAHTSGILEDDPQQAAEGSYCVFIACVAQLLLPIPGLHNSE